MTAPAVSRRRSIHAAPKAHLHFAADPRYSPRMAKTQKGAEAARLMLILPADFADAGFAAAIEEAGVAAVVVPVAENPDERAVLKRVKPLIEAIQAAGAAALIQGPADLLGKSGADGLHVAGRDAADAAERFRPGKIVGAGALRSRDVAMEAGEARVDYVMFGEPGADGGHPPLETVAERAAWWAEVFVVPCVAYAPRIEDIPALSATGAEFVAVGAAIFAAPDPRAALLEAAATLVGVEA